MEPWKDQMFEMARRENAAASFCHGDRGKLTEWTFDTLLPYMDVAFEAFGPDRLMFGSDWPVARLAVDYEPWSNSPEVHIDLVGGRARGTEGGNAIREYRLD